MTASVARVHVRIEALKKIWNLAKKQRDIFERLCNWLQEKVFKSDEIWECEGIASTRQKIQLGTLQAA